MRFRDFFGLIWEAAKRCYSDNTDRMAAEIAFNFLLSLAPLTLLVLFSASRFLGRSPARTELLQAVDRTLGSTARGLAEYFMNLVPRTRASGLAAVAGLLLMIWFSSSLFRRMRGALNAIWGMPPPPGLRPALRNWGASFVLVLIAVILVMAVLVLNLAASVIAPLIVELLPQGSMVARGLNFTVSYLLLAGALLVLFMRGPQVKLRVQDVSGAAFLTAAFYALANLVFSRLIWRSILASLYGAAGALIIIGLWVYYSAHIILFGAAYSRAYAEWRGIEIRPRREG
ncbi:MAG TPA: YihY/virulence factor BrkB family protein [Candidatus Saccharimonadales bacterium]|nr:YihY/virulence factor BrkB family protein [Candidatus Saccharimonadales bacterium]